MFRFLSVIATAVAAMVTGQALASALNSVVAGYILGFIAGVILGVILYFIGTILDGLVAIARQPSYYRPTSGQYYNGTTEDAIASMKARMDRKNGKTPVEVPIPRRSRDKERDDLQNRIRNSAPFRPLSKRPPVHQAQRHNSRSLEELHLVAPLHS